MIALLCKAFTGPGDEVLYSEYGFLMYPISALASGATPVKAPETKLTTNVDNILAAVTAKTKLIFIANPNNPTGTYIPKSELFRLRAKLSDDIVLVIDAAYAEYASRPDYTEGNDLVRDNNNVIVTRTFSKSHGLGGVRLGWGYGSRLIIDILNRIRGPFNVSAGAQAAGIASMLDSQFAKKVYDHNLKWSTWTREQLKNIGLETTDSIGNFLLISFNKGSSESSASAEKALKMDGILVRNVENYGLPNYLRITIGTKKEMQAVINSLTTFLNQNDAK